MNMANMTENRKKPEDFRLPFVPWDFRFQHRSAMRMSCVPTQRLDSLASTYLPESEAPSPRHGTSAFVA